MKLNTSRTATARSLSVSDVARIWVTHPWVLFAESRLRSGIVQRSDPCPIQQFLLPSPHVLPLMVASWGWLLVFQCTSLNPRPGGDCADIHVTHQSRLPENTGIMRIKSVTISSCPVINPLKDRRERKVNRNADRLESTAQQMVW